MKRIYLLLLLILPLLCAAEPGQTLISADLKQEPFIDAKTISTLPANTVIDVLKRQGGWMQIKAADTEGWVKMTSIKLGTGTADAKGDSGLKSLLNAATTGRSGNTGVTVATGVRGLSAEDLKNAKPNPEAVKKLDDYSGSKNEAQSFASSGKLQAQKIDYLADKSAGGQK
jgi:hypothetical protein